MSKLVCVICGKELSSWTARYVAGGVFCKNCFKSDEAEDFKFQKSVERDLATIENERTEKATQAKISSIKVSTLPYIVGEEIGAELDVVTAECVYGMNIFRDIFAVARDIVGGRSGASEKVLRDAKNVCLWELRKEAHEIGADAVIGVRLDYSEISGGGKSGMLFVVASGTAVTLRIGQ